MVEHGWPISLADAKAKLLKLEIEKAKLRAALEEIAGPRPDGSDWGYVVQTLQQIARRALKE